MPMDFPNMNSLTDAAVLHKFRVLDKDETELHYQEALANHVQKIDFVESCEIRYKVGWDKFSDEQNAAMVSGWSGEYNYEF